MRSIKIVHPQEGGKDLVTIQTTHYTHTNIRYTTRHGSRWVNKNVIIKCYLSDWAFIKGFTQFIKEL